MVPPSENLSPISCYSEYENEEKGKYDLTIMCVPTPFFQELEDKISRGGYFKIDEPRADLSDCVYKAWVLKEKFTEHLRKIMKAQFQKNIQKMGKIIAIYT